MPVNILDPADGGSDSKSLPCCQLPHSRWCCSRDQGPRHHAGKLLICVGFNLLRFSIAIQTALGFAAMYGYDDITQLLLEVGAVVDVVDGLDEHLLCTRRRTDEWE